MKEAYRMVDVGAVAFKVCDLHTPGLAFNQPQPPVMSDAPKSKHPESKTLMAIPPLGLPKLR